jgi:hypothetical protein
MIFGVKPAHLDDAGPTLFPTDSLAENLVRKGDVFGPGDLSSVRRHFSQQCGAHQTLKPFIPQTIQPLLRKQLSGQRQFFANDQELGIGLVAFG